MSQQTFFATTRHERTISSLGDEKKKSGMQRTGDESQKTKGGACLRACVCMDGMCMLHAMQ